MKAQITHCNKLYSVDFSKPLDISIPLRNTSDNPTAWYVDAPKFEPVRANGFVGSVAEGGSVNFRNIEFNPHGHGTHTECVGHISKEFYSINQSLTNFHFVAVVASITPDSIGEDLVITKAHIEAIDFSTNPKALVIRTLPNSSSKLTKQYSNSNPPYIKAEAMQYIINQGIEHFLIDQPSVDREVDGGELAAHHNFWNYPSNTQFQRTITEFVYVNSEIEDGLYLLNLQIAPFENDASPSKPILYFMHAE